MNKLLATLIAGTFASVRRRPSRKPRRQTPARRRLPCRRKRRRTRRARRSVRRTRRPSRRKPQKSKDGAAAVRSRRNSHGPSRSTTRRQRSSCRATARRTAAQAKANVAASKAQSAEAREDAGHQQADEGTAEGARIASCRSKTPAAKSVSQSRRRAGASKSLPFCFGAMRSRRAGDRGFQRIMREIETPRPAVTVAPIVERDGRFLLVEEETRARPAAQPARRSPRVGRDRCPPAPRARRSRKPAGASTPTALVGIYRWEAPDNGATFVRFAFCGDAVRARRGAAARRRHRARAVADLRRDRRAARRAPQPARPALHRRLSRGPALAARLRHGDALTCRGASA